MSRFLRAWIPIAVAVTGLGAMVAGAVQQDVRTGADEPAAQLAGDAAARVDGGAAPASVLPAESVDLRSAQGAFLIVFDGRGRQLASSAVLDGNRPGFPLGVLQHVPAGGDNRVTWAPAGGVRTATVSTRGRGGFVTARGC